MIIGIDVDSTVCNTTESVIQQHYADTGEKLTLDDIKDYEVDNIQGSLDDSASNLQLVTGSVNKLLQHYRRMFCNA